MNKVNLANFKEEYKITESLEKLEQELIGLQSVKDRIQEITAILFIDKVRQECGFSKHYPGLHMSFTGSPGTGKSTVAQFVADLLQKLGYLSRGQLVVASRDDLVAQFVGQTAPKTKEVLDQSMGGVLLIDEAYYLYKPNNEKDYGAEAIEMLLQVMENKRTDLVLIFAGYKEPMKTFYKSNPGLSSRITNHVHFPDFTQDELLQIGLKFADELQYELTEEATHIFYQYIGLRMQNPLFANARSIRNALDRARMRHANRIFNEGSNDTIITKGNLVTLEESDFSASRVFS